MTTLINHFLGEGEKKKEMGLKTKDLLIYLFKSV